MILCARSTSRSRNADQAARRCDRFVYFIVQITRLVIIKNGRHILGKMNEVRKDLWPFFLDCSFWVLIG